MAAGRIVQQIKQTEAGIDAFISRLTKILDRSLARVVSAISTGDLSILEVAGVLSRLEPALYEAGLATELDGLKAIYGEELRTLRAALGSAATGREIFTDIDADVIAALIDFDTEQVGRMLNEYVGDAKRVLMTATITGEVPNLEAFEMDFGGRLVNNLTSELNTSLAGFSRTLTIYKSEELGIEKFEYVGPYDKVTRPFCRERVGGIFTREQILSWDNDQGLPASIYLGGYNCRHRLEPVIDG